jgi:Tol biopolymer transport system component
VFTADDLWKSPRIALPGAPGAISPDGTQRVWESSDDNGTRLLAGSFDRPTEAKLVAQTKEGGFEVFGFARGGSRFLYWLNEEDGADSWAGPLDIYLGGGAHPLKTGAASMTTGLGHKMAALSPTADTVAIVVGDDGNVTNHDKSIALLDASTDSNQPVRKITGPSVSAIYPAWSPDGKQLAWTQGPDADALFKQLPDGVFYEVALERSARERRIWLARDGGVGEQKQLTKDPRYTDEAPVWSRDGNYILFVRLDEQDAITLWLMRPDGSDASEVAALSEKDDTSLLDGPDLFDWSFRL